MFFMLTVNAALGRTNDTMPKSSHDNMLLPELMEVSVCQFRPILSAHLREEIQVFAGHHLSASIGGSPYDVTVITRINSSRYQIQNNCIGERSCKFITGGQIESSLFFNLLNENL
jgi:hypothetical protein